MTLSTQIDVSDAIDSLDGLARLLARPTAVLNDIGQTVVDHVQLTFRDSTDPYGERWEPLTDVTLSRRRQGSNKPLMDSGRLRNSITAQVSGDSVEVGTNVVYASTHQFGAKQGAYGHSAHGNPIPWGNVPARRFLPINNGQAELPDSWAAEVGNTIASHLKRAMQ